MEFRNHIERQVEKKTEHYVAKIFKVIFFIILAIAFMFLVSYGFMLLWNWLMPDLFGLPTLNYWKALGVLILAKIIFGFGFGNSNESGKKKKMRKKWANKQQCSPRRDFSDWELYDQFWKEEGEASFKAYVEHKRKQNEPNNND